MLLSLTSIYRITGIRAHLRLRVQGYPCARVLAQQGEPFASLVQVVVWMYDLHFRFIEVTGWYLNVVRRPA